MYLLKVVGVVAITAAINAAWGSDVCSSVPALNCSCPLGWRLWRKACYRVTESEPNWECSKSACREMGGKMAAPRSLKEMKFMGNLARQKDSDYYVWIACNDIGFEGNWTCDVQEDSEPFMGWYPGQPDDTDHNQDCAVIAARHNDSMDDSRCSESHNALCVSQAACTPRPSQPLRYCFSSDDQGHIVNSACLLDHVIREFTTKSLTACGSACVNEAGCRSFNIKKNGKGKKLCQLNNSTSSEDKDNFKTIGDFCMYSEICIR
ncbi:C-type lectin domain family 4 member M-like [Acanthaster planci]|uniref:C-type lectin domain family 4 member M-like n=1 Tax=Acanthaster planci TaxID=133434 RepID=A0A8B7YDR3_ACAPL|nr:C-type lectin domain family 4 member M-like [Acanthaster planci]